MALTIFSETVFSFVKNDLADKAKEWLNGMGNVYDVASGIFDEAIKTIKEKYTGFFECPGNKQVGEHCNGIVTVKEIRTNIKEDTAKTSRFRATLVHQPFVKGPV